MLDGTRPGAGGKGWLTSDRAKQGGIGERATNAVGQHDRAVAHMAEAIAKAASSRITPARFVKQFTRKVEPHQPMDGAGRRAVCSSLASDGQQQIAG